MTQEQVEQIVCRCQQGEGPDDVVTLADTILEIHARKGCSRDLLSVIGRLYTVVADYAAVTGDEGHRG